MEGKSLGIPMLIVALVAAFGLVLTFADEDKPQAPAKSFSARESLSPNETLVDASPAIAPLPALAPVEETPAPVTAPAPAPAKAPLPSPQRKQPTRAPSAERFAAAPPEREATTRPAQPVRPRIEVEARRAHPDGRIQAAVIGAIAAVPNLSGQIGVQSRDAVVTLSGWTTTAGQALRAEKTARRVDGVRQVVNQIRPRMGPITS